MHSKTFVSPEQKSSRHDLFCGRKRSASPHCASALLLSFFSAGKWQLIHNNSLKECKQGDMWHFQPFYCIITFSSVLKACRRCIFWDCAILSPVAYIFEVLMRYPYHKQHVLAAHRQINASPAQQWLSKQFMFFGGSLLLLLNKSENTTVSPFFKQILSEVDSSTQYNRLKSTVVLGIFSPCLH